MNLRKLSLNQNTAEVLEKAAEMKKNGIEPDSMTYSYILQALSGEGMHKEAWAVIKYMEVKGINPDVSHFNSLLKVSFNGSTLSIYIGRADMKIISV